MSVSNDIIDEIRSRCNIVDILGEYLVLKRAGRNFKGLCPFHSEQTPSFMVSPDKQIFHCFGCGTGGNVLHFLMKIEGMTFIEVLEKLALRTGVRLPSPKLSNELFKRNKDKEQLFSLNEYIADYYHRCLKESSGAEHARNYLEKRKITANLIDRFNIGYSFGLNDLIKTASRNGYSTELLKKVGLVSLNSDKSGYHDYFYNRVVFPVYDNKKRVAGFGGRVIDDSHGPKYLNSPQTLLYNKSNILYGLDKAGPSIRLENKVIIMEGYIDVILAAQYGIKNAVATAGTALTENHISLLKRYTEEIIIIYDADSAGESATIRALELLFNSGLRVKIVCLPSGSDPDTFLREHGREKFLQLIDNSLSVIDYRYRLASEKVDSSTVDGKIYIMKQILHAIAGIDNAVEQDEEIRKLARRISVKEESLYVELRKIKIGSNKNKIGASLFGKEVKSGLVTAQHELVQCMLRDNYTIEHIKKELDLEDFTVPELKSIVSGLFNLHDSGKAAEPANLMNELDDERLNQLISQLVVDEKHYEHTDEVVNGLINTVKNARLQKKYISLEAEIKREMEEGHKVNNEKLQEYNRLTQMIKGSRRNSCVHEATVN